MKLWSSDDCAEWRTALADYDAVVLAHEVNRLPEADAWYRRELPALLASRKTPYVTRDELAQVTAWKMKRGVWRERNRLLVIGNDAQVVKQASHDAFAAVPDFKQPVAILSELAGVGPATASAVLAAYRPDLYPFFDEWIAAQVPGLGKVAFTAPYYQKYAAALRQRADELNAVCQQDEWNAHLVGQALWAHGGGKLGVR